MFENNIDLSNIGRIFNSHLRQCPHTSHLLEWFILVNLMYNLLESCLMVRVCFEFFIQHNTMHTGDVGHCENLVQRDTIPFKVKENGLEYIFGYDCSRV